MSMTSYPVQVIAKEAVHFVEGLIQNAATPMYNLPIPGPAARRWIIRAITVVSLQNLSWEFDFFSSASGINADPALDRFRGNWQFDAASGAQFAGAGVYRYFLPDLSIPYEDRDATQPGVMPSLHVVLVNRSVGAKLAGAAGNLQVDFWLEPAATVQS